MIRGGTDIVPIITENKERAKRLSEKAAYEIILSAISGSEDEGLIRQLLQSQDPTYRSQEAQLACHIMVAANSTRWLKQLDELQYREYFDNHIASKAMAIIHRDEAIPMLEAAPESNYSASYAVKELLAWRE